uniref:Uncharacterized protein n=1 Tax=Setaria viridis TaxID=4556 RepID=A0A4U6TP40_SETVI|nr:hypothetical protein SEVIR_7G040005v2 [Setaria viridis]
MVPAVAGPPRSSVPAPLRPTGQPHELVAAINSSPAPPYSPPHSRSTSPRSNFAGEIHHRERVSGRFLAATAPPRRPASILPLPRLPPLPSSPLHTSPHPPPSCAVRTAARRPSSSQRR